jgi:hypothetical protein
MAYQPIVLSSNLVSDGNIGALPGLAYSIPDEDRTAIVTNEDGTITVPTYQLASNTPTFDLQNMQNIYGTKYMPMFRWISQKQTGSVTFDPDEGQISEEEIAELTSDFEAETGMTADEALKEQYKQEAIGVGSQIAAGIGGQIGRAYASTGSMGSALDAYTSQDFGDLLFPTGDGATAKLKYSPGTKNAIIAAEKGNAAQDQLKAAYAGKGKGLENTIDALDIRAKDPLETQTIQKAAKDRSAELTSYKGASGDTGYLSGLKDRSGFLKTEDGKMSAAGKANLYGAAGAGIGAIAANLIAGKNLRESVESGAKVGVGTYVGTLIGGPLGGMIGGLLGGRVICNELMRQKIMTRKQVVMDYKFTKDYLTPQHVAGYHIWAVWMVRQMRKGRLVNFWAHVAGHRANEIAYIYGKRDKPDYLGKVYRKVLEPICWSIGLLCKKTDWEVLYKQKEV